MNLMNQGTDSEEAMNDVLSQVELRECINAFFLKNNNPRYRICLVPKWIPMIYIQQ